MMAFGLGTPGVKLVVVGGLAVVGGGAAFVPPIVPMVDRRCKLSSCADVMLAALGGLESGGPPKLPGKLLLRAVPLRSRVVVPVPIPVPKSPFSLVKGTDTVTGTERDGSVLGGRCRLP